MDGEGTRFTRATSVALVMTQQGAVACEDATQQLVLHISHDA